MLKQDEIIKFARQVGYTPFEALKWEQALTNFAKLVADVATAKEREACAKLVESLPPVGVYRQLERATFKDAAIAIRARGEQ